jgi:Uma2 family endonuclease
VKAAKKPRFVNMAEVLEQLGDISPVRVRLHPAPGTATEKDLLQLRKQTKLLYELVEGTLVEKVMGSLESSLGCDLIRLLGNFLDQNPLGFLLGPDGAVRLLPDLVLIPDISFISWEQLPRRERPREPISSLAPALAVEILSPSNTKKEMERKVRQYFLGGVQMVWFVDGDARTVQVFTVPDQVVTLSEDQTLDGGAVLPGFSLPLRRLFAQVPPPPRARHKGKR